ncbi:uncharacterized protein LOC129966950 [Argiope bruennichi]|uniref:Uncharacterized protein n=1 Tax=Argiope bruennichi TaxID=94029 RepID=A0A8T0E8C6_ARGBR|nr:uncharacterized protein LOC129966950 [Argiope bruennichi]KAF8767658.1 hypothetical protein HNY73_020580 [Argiope bruennichi]
MKLVISNILFLALAGYALGAAVENCHFDRLMKCGDPLDAFRKEMGQSFPTTEDQVKKLCSNMDEALKCAEEFQNKCMTPLQLETMGFLAEGAQIVYKDFCTDGSNMRAEYLKHAQCIDDASKTDEAKGYYSYVEAALEDLTEKPPTERLPTTCCGYKWLDAKFNKMGKEKCGQEAVDAFKNVVEMVVSSLPNVLCSGFEPDSKQCTAVLPAAGATPKGTIKNSHIAQTFASVYLPDLQ